MGINILFHYLSAFVRWSGSNTDHVDTAQGDTIKELHALNDRSELSSEPKCRLNGAVVKQSTYNTMAA
jgi:hypothetical protein